MRTGQTVRLLNSNGLLWHKNNRKPLPGAVGTVHASRPGLDEAALVKFKGYGNVVYVLPQNVEVL